MGATRKMLGLSAVSYVTLGTLLAATFPAGYDSITWIVGGLALTALAVERIYSQIQTVRTAAKLSDYDQQLEEKDQELQVNILRLENAFRLIEAQRLRNDGKDQTIRDLQQEIADLRGGHE